MIGKRYEYDVMAECEKELWWYKCLHDITLNKIERSFPKEARILDAGCGTGGLLSHLQKNGYTNLSGFDLSADAIRYASNYKSIDVRLLNILHCDSTYPENFFDVIISHDILCLLRTGEDKDALSKLVSILKPGGLLLMNLPAGESFKGTHDMAVGITRRYSQSKVKDMAGSEVRINEFIYWPFFLSPIILAVRVAQRLRTVFANSGDFKSDVKLPPAFLNRFFYKLTAAENKVWKSKPWGSSIFVSLSKR